MLTQSMRSGPVRLSVRQLDHSLSRPSLCPTCAHSQPSTSQPPRKRVRYASTVTSRTAVNATKLIPEQYKPLHNALQDIRKHASSYVNLSRLELALQGLEAEKPKIRIAVLGTSGQETTLRLVRALLADALGNEAAWEKSLLQRQDNSGVLIEYGEPLSASISRPMRRATLEVMSVPSETLQRWNLELLVWNLNTSTNGDRLPADVFLVPRVETQTSFDGRQVSINQPVHGAFLVADGFDHLIATLQTLAAVDFRTVEDKQAVNVIANIPDSNLSQSSDVLVSDVSRAEKGLQAIRTSISQAQTYEYEWLASGLPQIRARFEALQQSLSQPMSPPVANLVKSILASATKSLDDLENSSVVVNPALSLATQTNLLGAIDEFSRAAHSELQSGLASAWSSRNWRKLSWYKLFWRVDDVGLIVADLVNNAWLPKTERAVYELSGRLIQVGITPTTAQALSPPEQTTAFDTEPIRPTITEPAPVLLATTATTPTNEIVLEPPPQQIVTSSPTTNTPIVVTTPAPRPLPLTSLISTSRATYLTAQISNLTSQAQQLLLRTLSLSSLSAFASTVLYASSLAPTVYEAGTLFAAGTVFALFRMQRGWEYTCQQLETGLFDHGREVIRRVTGQMRALVESRAQEESKGDPVEKKLWTDAKSAVERASQGMDRLEKKQNSQ